MTTRPRKGMRRTGRTELREPAGFKALSKAEQIRYLQRLWDRITDGPAQLPVPKSHLSPPRNDSPRTVEIRAERGPPTM
jgi:hypothetical protein